MSNVIRPLLRGWVPGLMRLHQTHSQGVQRSLRRTPSTSEPAPKATSKEPEKVVRGKDGKDMLLVPEGWFEMGSNEEVEAAIS